MRITISHPDLTGNPKTFIDNPNGILAGAISITVKNTSGFSPYDLILLGNYGDEDAEIVRISSISTNTFFVTPTSFAHEQETPITKIDYNQFKVYKSTTGINGTYNLVATKALNVDERNNFYEEFNVSSTDYFKFSYYNSYSTIESELSSPISASGFSFETLKYIQDRILILFGDLNEEKIKRDYITDWLNEYYESLQIRLAGGSSGRFVSSADISVNNSKTVDLSSYNILQLFLVEFSTDGTDFDNLLLPINFQDEFSETDLTRPIYAYFKVIGNTMYFEDEITGTIRIWYWSAPTRLSDETDTLVMPFGYSTEAFVNYGTARAYEKDRKFDEAKYFRQLVKDYEDRILPYLKNKLRYSKYYMKTTFRNSFI
jgi:hypothetical protein